MRANPVLTSRGAHPIAAIQDRARSLRDQGRDLIDFSIGDPREPTPDFIPAALHAAVPEVSQYPTTKGLAALRDVMSRYVNRRLGVEIDPESQVMPTSGSKEAIFSTPLALVDRARSDVIVWPDPGYPVYGSGAAYAGAEGVAVPVDDDFILRADSIPGRLWEKMAILWLCSPSNPTGAVTDLGTLASIVEKAKRHEVLVCSDECYLDLYEGDPPPSILQVTTKGVLSYLSLSKRSGMTGYRSGAIVGDPKAIDLLHRFRTSTGTASPEFIQSAALAAWSDDEHVAERRKVFAAKREVLRPFISEAGFGVVASHAGIYLWVDLDGNDDVEVTAKLLESGVVVSPGSIFGSRGRGHLRLALVPTVKDCARAGEMLVSGVTSGGLRPGQ